MTVQPSVRPTPDAAVCPRCDGDGYTETWNDDQSDVVIAICARCNGTGSGGVNGDPSRIWGIDDPR